MEVHHHSHHGKKKWTEYFWEFFMLFLAVTLGFFVENQREHYIEHQRAKKYAKQMYNDLKKDTGYYNFLIADIGQYVTSFDTVNALFDISPPVSNQRLIAALLPKRSTYPVVLVSTTFNQMRSSGSLRYFSNDSLSNKISEYYEFTHPMIHKATDYANDFFTKEIQSFMLDHFDYNESDYQTDKLKVADPKYIDRNPKTDILIRNRFVLYNSLLKFNIDKPVPYALNEAKKLLDLLKKEYTLK
jgi:hypothetical protein